MKVANGVAPTADLFTYLDDRLVLATSAPDISAIYNATTAFDACCGPSLNTTKSYVGLASPTGRRRCMQHNTPLQRADVIKYLGTSLPMQKSCKSPVAEARVSRFRSRCLFIRQTPTDNAVSQSLMLFPASGTTVVFCTILHNYDNALPQPSTPHYLPTPPMVPTNVAHDSSPTCLAPASTALVNQLP